MKIPQTFMLGRHRWRVLRPDTLPYQRRGECVYDAHEVRIARRSATGRQYTAAEQFETLLHEIIHAALELDNPAHNRETVVQPLAHKLAQALRTATFSKEIPHEHRSCETAPPAGQDRFHPSG